MKQYAVLSIAILVAGLFVAGFLDQDSFARPPKPPPEKIKVDVPTHFGNAFEVPIKVILPEEISHIGYTVETKVFFFKPDGTPIRAQVTNSVPENNSPKEGGIHDRTHELLASIPYEVPEELVEVEVTVEFTGNLINPDGTVVASKVKYADIVFKRG